MKPTLKAAGMLVLLVIANFILMPLLGAQAAQRPNIVIMLSDNLGYGDLGSYGGGIIRGAPTPQLDKLADEGTRFTNFNTELECTPSRSALMTGRMAVRSGTTRAVGVPGTPGGLAPWEVTIAEVLKEQGYDTAIYGKWHLGGSDERFPTEQGFDEWWGFPFSTSVTWYHEAYKKYDYEPGLKRPPYILEGRTGEKVRKVKIYDKNVRPYIDENIAQKSVDYIKAHAKSKRPFFLYIPWSLVHHPSLPHPDFAGKSSNGNFGDAIMEHDYMVGQVVKAVDDAGIADNTIIVYASDNGPDRAEFPAIGDSGPFRGYLGDAHEGSIRTPMFIRWPGKVPTGRVTNEIVSLHDFFPTLTNIVGGEIPDDRAIDGVDQTDFFTGKTDKSARESLLLFSGETLMAVKWRQFKIYLKGESPLQEKRHVDKIWAPEIYDLHQDPKELSDMLGKGLWLVEPTFRTLMPFVYSVQKYGLVEPGGEKPTRYSIETPFYNWTQMELSLSALKKKAITKKLENAYEDIKKKVLGEADGTKE